MRAAVTQIGEATAAAWASGNPAQALANAVPYMQAFGHTVLAWIWLDVAVAAWRNDATQAIAISVGKTSATAYFFNYELPKASAWLQVVRQCDLTCSQTPEDAF